MHKFGNIYLGIKAIIGTSVFGIIARPAMEREIKVLTETSPRNLSAAVEKESRGFYIHMRDVYIGYHSSHFRVIETDPKIVRCLLSDSRITIVDIANRISDSRRTVIRRMEAMTEYRLLILVLFTIPLQ